VYREWLVSPEVELSEAEVSAHQWHGVEGDSHIDPATVPQMPPDYTGGTVEPEDETAGLDRAPDPGHVWTTVVFSGNYGVGCTQYQRQTYHDVAEAEINHIGWTLFGLCPGWTVRRSDQA
jgi:hypothetical protein